MSKTSSNRILIAAVCCGIAGFIGFSIQESDVRASEMEQPGSMRSAVSEEAAYFGLIGLLIGAGLVLADEYGSTSGKRLAVRMFSGALAGGLCGGLGGIVGQIIYSVLLSGGTNIASVIIARTVGWAAVGAGTGLSGGLICRSPQKAIKGLIGGAIGGGIGGILFDLVSIVFLSGTISRMVGETAIGVCIGIFVVAIEEMTKSAWITVVAGRNEGKQYILFKPTTTIGRNELSDIPLFGDMNVAKNHAVIQTTDGHSFVYIDGGSPTGSYINGTRVTQKVCADRDSIQIGKFTLIFSLRAQQPMPAGQQPIQPPPYGQPAPPPTAPYQNPNICPFCGTAKDPYTGRCMCSPASTSPQSTASNPSLVTLNGPYAPNVFRIQKEQVTVGRDSSNDIVLDMDSAVSRRHAIIGCENGIYYIEDVGSTNGTYVNGMRIQRCVLKEGDVVHIGNSDFGFRLL